METGLNIQDPCCLSHTELMSSWRNVSARSDMRFRNHGYKKDPEKPSGSLRDSVWMEGLCLVRCLNFGLT
nr:hypothetical protein Iba_scaffold9378CG0020 [Ipomoea batatas]